MQVQPTRSNNSKNYFYKALCFQDMETRWRKLGKFPHHPRGMHILRWADIRGKGNCEVHKFRSTKYQLKHFSSPGNLEKSFSINGHKFGVFTYKRLSRNNTHLWDTLPESSLMTTQTLDSLFITVNLRLFTNHLPALAQLNESHILHHTEKWPYRTSITYWHYFRRYMQRSTLSPQVI
jgi:hypothetical protein